MMLVADVQFIKDRKVVVCWLLALVRLYLVQEFPALVWHRWIYLRVGGYLITDARLLQDGKGSATVPSQSRSPTRSFDKLPGKVIKRDSKVVDGISKYRGQVGGHSRHTFESEDVL